MRITRGQEIGRAARINSAPAIGALAALGLSVVWVVLRMSVLHDWTHTFRPTLEYDSANAARTIWFALHPDALAQWQRVWLQAGSGRFIEPPILQTLTALTYFPGGVERPWTSAIFTSLAWLMAGALLWDVCRRLVGSLEASVGLAYFLFAPFAIAVSRIP